MIIVSEGEVRVRAVLASVAKRFYLGLGLGERRLGRVEFGAVVLSFHSINIPQVVEDLISPSIVTLPGNFRKILEMLRAKTEVMSLEDLPERLAVGPPPGRLLSAVTLDDGYRDNYELALPILAELGLPATVFLTTGAVDRSHPFWVARLRYMLHHTRATQVRSPTGKGTLLPLDSSQSRIKARARLVDDLLELEAAAREERLDQLERELQVEPSDRLADLMLTWEQARQMRQAGIRFGSHTVHHGNLALSSDDELERELGESRERIVAEVGDTPITFCYPNTGDRLANVDQRSRAAVAQAGYTAAVTSRFGAVGKESDRFILPRVAVYQSASTPAEVYVRIVRSLGSLDER